LGASIPESTNGIVIQLIDGYTRGTKVFSDHAVYDAMLDPLFEV
jgi:hypothetical protein